MAVAASLWALASPAFVYLPLFEDVVAEGVAESTNASDAGKLGEALAVLVTTSILGLVSLAASRMHLKGRQPAQFVMMGAVGGFFVLTILTADSVGPLLIGPAVLLMFPALWLVPLANPDTRPRGG